MIAAYGFQQRWRGKLASGKKRMTIRARRKDGRLPRPGDTFRGYIGMRTKNCELVVEAMVTQVQPIWIRRRADRISVSVMGFIQRKSELLALAKSDGFESVEDFVAWFLPAGREDFEGHIRMPGCAYMERVGKKLAGRLLDGREWNDVPHIAPVIAAGGGREP